MLLIKNARIITMSNKDYDNGCILINSEGKIEEVKEHIDDLEGIPILDVKGKIIIPGMIDPHCHVGMWEDGMGFEGDDGNEITDPITPQLEAIDGINPFDNCFTEALEAGITTVVTGPGSANVIAGQFAALKTASAPIEDMILKAPVAMKISFGENPKRTYMDKEEAPMTRMAIAAMLKENFIRAKQYVKNNEEFLKEEDASEPEFDYKYEALSKVIRKEIPLKAHAHRADDILTALRIANQFDLDITIDHCTEGALIVEELIKKNARVIVGPIISERSKIELKNATASTPGILSKAGLKVAIMTDHPVIPVQYLPVSAALAVREGMDEKEALKSITINAAEIVGIADRVGSIEKGKDADLVIFDGNPLDIMSKPYMVIIDGKIKYKYNPNCLRKSCCKMRL